MSDVQMRYSVRRKIITHNPPFDDSNSIQMLDVDFVRKLEVTF